MVTPQQKQQRTKQRKVTEYGVQLQEKQRTRNSYGLREAQFRRYFNAATKFRGQTGTILLQTLERRLDNILFRAGLVKTRRQARQLLSHRHFTHNGKRVSIASILVNVGDVVAPYKQHDIELNPDVTPADWLKVDKKTGQITVERLPKDTELPIEFDTQKIIEFYSR